ncbi:MAG: hypothetical protein U9Q73_03345 [Nanoarchaeota archaeon]|nr:hypothetical protein [Nanoarchaeota archaeon]
MKKRFITTIFILLLLTPLLIAEDTPQTIDEDIIDNIENKLKIPIEKNPWNETVIISSVWQKLIGGFFGLNLHDKSTEISVREAIVFFMVFVMFFVIILDILKITPFFKIKILDAISGEFVVALIITTIVSITGVFINLKNLFLAGVTYTVTKLDWAWLHFMIENKFWGPILTILIVFPIFFIIWQFFDLIEPIIKKYSQVSRAEAKGRMIGRAISKTD